MAPYIISLKYDVKNEKVYKHYFPTSEISRL